MEKVIIFGGCGFIGKNLTKYLKKFYDVIVIDKYIDDIFLKENKIEFYQYDFENIDQLKKIIDEEKPNYIINLISYVTSVRELSLFPKMINSNLDILLKIYETTKDLENLKLVMQFGSGEEYGNIESPFTEIMKEEPVSPYAIAKLLTTNTALMLYKNYNYPICIVRPSNLFGKYQAKDKFIPYILEKLKNNEKILTTFGEQKRDFISIDDFVNIIQKLLEKSSLIRGEVINVGSGISISLKDIILYLKEKLNSTSEIKFGAIPYRENEMMNFCLDISKLESILDKKLKMKWLEKIIEE
ncbi:NAD(P)-dependent oxidoreductase [uncultured Fusobacterium sp.]|uniref:NAD-dependent epimerase/dehydratase family protein n=1 Tax=uncultured Fusobacterium sp. TaxID=159267 RepID=UPI0025F6BDDB|nr:NAD(P)-dependent oxidoreductase [uncultured Fusobacterium sp.]